ncbi:hypothetical protein [Bartonella ancashensis]|uniref:Uncharacterized protein n=1 Tax=Bartonella ancashensis TaxID=1318743 RepID=A0A0M4LIM2_9HYPH|nr:hypothetical protein [Bartonella ancashensis]ALE02939.1 hypothetical protein PU02_0125 [Bartonella ancashensis]
MLPVPKLSENTLVEDDLLLKTVYGYGIIVYAADFSLVGGAYIRDGPAARVYPFRGYCC